MMTTGSQMKISYSTCRLRNWWGLQGIDTETRVTIIDDDKPGQIAFEETNIIRLLHLGFMQNNIIRKNGSDGEVQVEYQTEQVQGEGMAIAGQDYVSEGLFCSDMEKP